LAEILPYIIKYHNKIVVIKYGRNENEELKHSAIQDIVLLKFMGLLPVVVHGGGPVISQEMKKRGIIPQFINGLRVTNDETLKIINDTFRRIRNEITSLIKECKAKAIGLSGADNELLIAKKISTEVDLGYVGEVIEMNTGFLNDLLTSDNIPVVSPLGIGKYNRQEYNINADHAAAKIAIELGAEKLTMVTNVEGIIDRNGKTISHLTTRQANNKMKKGTISGGMIQKVQACIIAVEGRCPKAHIISGQDEHSLLYEIFTDRGIGTEILP